jgi:HEAT repeats
MRSAAAMALREFIAEESMPDLVQKLKSYDEWQRNEMNMALKELKVGEALPELLRNLRNPDSNIRKKAAEDLGLLRAAESVPDLFHLLKYDPSWNVRSAAANSLGKMKTKEALQDLVWVLKEGDWLAYIAGGGSLAMVISSSQIPNVILSSDQQIKILQKLATHPFLLFDQRRLMANQLSALHAATSTYQDPFQKYELPPAQKTILVMLGFFILVFLAAFVVMLDTFFGTIQDVFKSSFGPLIEQWISSHPALAFVSLLVLGVLIVIVIIFRDRFAELLPGKLSKGG